jgi:hypothetical protein
VLIDALKGKENVKTKLFKDVIKRNVPYGFAAYTYQEVLQGASNEREYSRLKEYLSVQRIYFLPEEIKTYEKAAVIYYNLRRQGITPRSTIDILIALTAMEHNLLLLHNDKDFDAIASKIADLKILNRLYD